MITVSQISNSQYFGTWLTRVNQIASIISSNTVTADLTANGSLTTGNSFVNGALGTVFLAVGNTLTGGTIQAPANLAIGSNTAFLNGLTSLANIVSNSTVSTFNVSTNNLVISNQTAIVGNASFANTINANGNINSNTSLSVTGFFNVNASLASFGNSTVNASINSTFFNATSNNALYLGGIAANLYQLNSTLAANVLTMTANNSNYFNGQNASYYANVTSPGFTTSVSVGANVSLTTTQLSIGNSTANVTINSTSIQANLINANNINATVATFGNSTVNATVNSTFFNATSNNALYLGTIAANQHQLNSTLAANVAGMTANNSNNFNGQPASYYANVTSPQFTTSVSVGGNVNLTTAQLSIGNSTANVTINATFLQASLINANNINVAANVTVLGSLNVAGNLVSTGTTIANGSQIPTTDNTFYIGNTTNRWIGNFSAIFANTISFGNSTVNSSINSTAFSGTANNANYLGGVAAAQYQLNSTLAANVAGMNANNSNYLGTVAASLYQLNSTLAANVAGMTSNSANYIGALPAANVVSNSQLQSNLSNYQTTAGLASNVAGLTANNANYLGTVAASLYQLNSTLAANVGGMTSNSANYIGALPAANVVSNSQLQANLANYPTNSNLSANLANYVLTSTLSANVAGMTANNATNLNGQPASYYANVTSYPGAFNGTTVNATSLTTSLGANISGQINVGSGVVSSGLDNGGSGGQYRITGNGYGIILRNDGTNFYLMQTASANALGTWNAYRPFQWNLANGAVIIDGSNSGVTIGGYSTFNNSLIANANGSNIAIEGSSANGWGVYGLSNSSIGVYGISNTSTGVYGQSNTGVGGYFVSANGTTVLEAANSTVVTQILYTNGTISMSNGSVSATIGPSNYTGTANNANNLGGHPSTFYYAASNPSGYISGITSGMVTGALGYTPLSGINSSMVTSALGYTPYNSSNPSGYISGISSGMVTGALGYTPLNSSYPSYSGNLNGPNWGVDTSGNITTGGNITTTGTAQITSFLGNFGTSSGGGMNIAGNQGNALQVNSYSGAVGIQVYSGAGTGIQIQPNGGDFIHFANNSGGQIGQIVSNNHGGVLYQSGSDYRIKTDIEPLANTLDKILNLKPVSYTMNGGRGDGFIAHEIQEQFPLIVTGEKDAVYANGMINIQQLDYGRLTPYLVKAIHELQDEIKLLKAEININKKEKKRWFS